MSSLTTFIYCFDENYNQQAALSILSLLRNVDKKIDLKIIHQNKNSFNKFLEIISKEKFLNDLKIYNFNLKNINFPNLTNKHISEATYYRLFIDKVLNNEHDIQKAVYVDSDIICLSNPLKEINHTFELLDSENILIGAKTDSSNEQYDFKYFNAGVLVFDYSKWVEKNIFDSLRKILYSDNLDFKYWDQDVLNYFFKGNFKELSEILNYEIDTTRNNFEYTVNQKIVFLHYLGNKKPWHISSLNYENTNIYQNVYRTIFKKNYLLIPQKLGIDLKGFLKLYKENGVKYIFDLNLLVSVFKIFKHHIMKKLFN